MILEENDIHQLNDDAYTLNVATAGEEMGWQESMAPVCPLILLVKGDHRGPSIAVLFMFSA